MSTLFVGGVWYEVEITECYTYMIVRDRNGAELRFYNDAQGLAEMSEYLEAV